MSHQCLGAAARGETHLYAAGRVGGGEQRLRPRRVVAVDEDGLGAVNGERFRIGDEALDRELEVPPLFHRALRQHAWAPGLRAHEDRDRVQRRVAGDANRGLDLGEAARGSLSRVCCEERRALLQVRHVRLVGRPPPRAQLLERKHQLDRVEHRDDAREPGRRQPARQPDELVAVDVDVDERAGQLPIGQRSRVCRCLEVEAVPRNKVVDDVELVVPAPVDPDDASVLDHELRLRVVRAVERDEPELRPRRDEQLAAELASLARDEALRPSWDFAHRRPGARAVRRRRAPHGRRRRSAAHRSHA